MIRRSINPFDARKWLEECCVTRQLIGCASRRSTRELMTPTCRRADKPNRGGRWTEWVDGRGIPVPRFRQRLHGMAEGREIAGRPEPTPIGSLGEVLTNAGFGSKRDKKARYRRCPTPTIASSNCTI